MQLKDLWHQSNTKVGIKVRFIDWGHQQRYFEIHGHNQEKAIFFGVLDSGEKASYPEDSNFWKFYVEGSEMDAQAS